MFVKILDFVHPQQPTHEDNTRALIHAMDSVINEWKPDSETQSDEYYRLEAEFERLFKICNPDINI
jgi:hypothetical protein